MCLIVIIYLDKDVTGKSTDKGSIDSKPIPKVDQKKKTKKKTKNADSKESLLSKKFDEDDEDDKDNRHQSRNTSTFSTKVSATGKVKSASEKGPGDRNTSKHTVKSSSRTGVLLVPNSTANCLFVPKTSNYSSYPKKKSLAVSTYTTSGNPRLGA